MSQLAACNGKAKNTVGDADKAGVDDKDVDTLRDLVASNGKLIRSKRAGLSISESERLSTKADKATKRTRTLAGKVDRLVKAKPLMDARRKCRDALDKAVKASTDAKPSDDATRAAKATLDKLIGQARKLDAKTTVDTWNDMASKLDKRAGTSPRRWTRKPKRRGSQTAGRSAGASPTASPATATADDARADAAVPPLFRLRLHQRAARQRRRNHEQQQWRNIQRQLRRWYVPPETNDNSLPSNDSSL